MTISPKPRLGGVFLLGLLYTSDTWEPMLWLRSNPENKTSSLAAKVLSGSMKATQQDVKKLAASVLSQDETKGKRKK